MIMLEKEIVVNIHNGLHARPAANLIKKMNAFKSQVEFHNGTKKVNAKNILNLMGLSIKEGQAIKVTVDGEDEAEALQCVEAFLQSTNT
jgi:phosphotransferase system HPr (HPr) family protein